MITKLIDIISLIIAWCMLPFDACEEDNFEL
jgi:hypothetical protein